MTKNKQLTLIALLVLLLFGCKKDELTGKYKRPTWLAGKLYTQILTKPDTLSTFAELLKISGYDTIIDVSGSYTVFAPSNEAFKAYFKDNPKYKSVADMPKAEVVKLVKYHITQDAWSKKQLTQLDVWGWIDTLDLKNNEPRGYKRQTLLLPKNRNYGYLWSRYLKYGTTTFEKRRSVTDTTATSLHRRVITDSRKYVPFFYKEYLNFYGLTTSDYEFYFGRQFQNINDIYIAGGRLITNEVFAENGFIYVIDKVLEPLKNGMELLTATNSNGQSYSKYYNLVNLFSQLDWNEKETNSQAGASAGLKVDSLFNLTYPQLVFDINSEKTKFPRGTEGLPGNVTIRYHQGMVAPTNEAMSQLESQYLAGGNNWGSIDAAPENIKRIIANSCLSINPIYLTDVHKGFLNGEADIIKIDESSIVQKEYGSNCTFIGVNKPIVPRAFSSVAGPVYLRKGFSKAMYAIEKAGLLSALKRKPEDNLDKNNKPIYYSFFVENDVLSSIDSSFIYNEGRGTFTAIPLYPSLPVPNQITVTDLRILLLNHIGLSRPISGGARKQFIKNLAGNYITFDDVTKEVRGTAPSVYGFHGFRQVTVIPNKISTNSDNGETFEITNWLNYSVNNLYSYITLNYNRFHRLMVKAGFDQASLYKYSFMSDNQTYTVLVPSDAALTAANVDAMSVKDLQKFLQLHFIQSELIFTDGSSQPGYYETCRIDESSTPYVTVYTKIKVQPGIDQITFPLKNGSPAVVVNESAKTNVLTGRSLGTGAEPFTNSVNTGVIHEIDKALVFGEVDTK